MEDSCLQSAIIRQSLSGNPLDQPAHINQQVLREKVPLQNTQSYVESEPTVLFSSLASHFVNTTRPAYDADQLASSSFSTGPQVMEIHSSVDNQHKYSASYELQKPADGDMRLLDEFSSGIGNTITSEAPRLKNWPTVEAKRMRMLYNLNPLVTHCNEVSDNNEVALGPEAFKILAAEAGLGSSHPANENLDNYLRLSNTSGDGLGSSHPANENLDNYLRLSNTSGDGVQPYLVTHAYSDSLRSSNVGILGTGLGPSCSQQSRDVNVPYESVPLTSSFQALRHSNQQSFVSVASPSDRRYGSNNSPYNMSLGGYGRSGAAPGTKLLLLPGSHEAVRRAQARSSDMSLQNSTVASYNEMGLRSVSLPQWDRPDCGRICQGETFSVDGSSGLLRNSQYLQAAQQLLDEFCNVKRWVSKGLDKGQEHIMEGAARREVEDVDQAPAPRPVSCTTPQKITLEGYCRASSEPEHPDQCELTEQLMMADERCHLQVKKARLVTLVEELDRRYRQYRDHMQLVITSFESATGLGAAAPYTDLARQAMSRHFRSLRDAISDHIQRVCESLGEELSDVPILNRGETPRLRVLDQRLRHQHTLHQLGALQQQAWRPQRGLPEQSVSVLRAWLFEHFLHPYPKDSEKHMLARLTGLSRSQVSNWFINARVRLWKPMVEEMYAKESIAGELQDESGSADQGRSRADDGVQGGEDARSPAIHVNATDITKAQQQHGVMKMINSNDIIHDRSSNSWRPPGFTLTLGLHHPSFTHPPC